MRVAIRADAARSIGAGHVMRCLALADALREGGTDVTFVFRQHPGHLGSIIAQHDVTVLALAARQEPTAAPSSWFGTSPTVDAAEMRNALSTGETYDWLIVDHYAASHDWLHGVRPTTRRLAAIDDLANRSLGVDLLVDHNFGAESKPYGSLIPGSCSRLFGPSYALLDTRFAVVRASLPRREPSNDLGVRVLLSLGGADPTNATSKVLEALADELAEVGMVDVVIGSAHPDPGTVNSQCQALPNARLHWQVSNMPWLMANADVAIGAGGVSTLERACIGLPTVAIRLASNQDEALDALHNAGVHWYVREGLAAPSTLRNAFRELVDDVELRARMRSAGQAAVDGYGATRVAHELANLAARPASVGGAA